MNDPTMALPARLDALRQSFRQQAFPPLDEQLARLQALAQLILDNQAALADAVSADFGRHSVVETKLLELFPALEAIRHARRHLPRWMKRQRRGVAFWFWPGRAWVEPQPLGVVGILVPWNYPLYLPFGGLGHSGMGHYHGREGFLTFSHLRPVFRQGRSNALGWMRPPYSDRARKVLALMLRR